MSLPTPTIRIMSPASPAWLWPILGVLFLPKQAGLPEILWMVDDIWLSGQLALNEVPIWLNAEDPRRTKGSSNEVKEASLRKLVHEGHGRTEANQACVDYFRNTYRIWGG